MRSRREEPRHPAMAHNKYAAIRPPKAPVRLSRLALVIVYLKLREGSHN